MKIFYLSIFLIVTLNPFIARASSCNEQGFFFYAKAIQFESINQKAKKRFTSFPMESNWDLHSGRYDQIIVKSSVPITQIVFSLKNKTYTWKLKPLGNKKFTTTLKNLKEEMSKIIALGPGKIYFKVYANETFMCRKDVLLL